MVEYRNRGTSIDIEETIEIGCIRIFCEEHKMSGRIADLRSADRMLSSWTKSIEKNLDCGFQIHFEDGFSMEGTLLVRRADRNALLGYLRRGIQNIVSQQPINEKNANAQYPCGEISKERLLRYRLGDGS